MCSWSWICFWILTLSICYNVNGLERSCWIQVLNVCHVVNGLERSVHIWNICHIVNGLERRFCHCLGLHGRLCCTPWWSLLVCAPWESLFCLWEPLWYIPWSFFSKKWLINFSPSAAQVLVVHLAPGSMWLDASCSAASGESSLSRAGLFSGKILKVSFSTVSYLVFLASTQSSKVLKEIDLLSVSSMVLKESLLVPFLMVHYKTLRSLKRVRATDLRLHVLEGNIFPPYLTNGPERSLYFSLCWSCHWPCHHFSSLWKGDFWWFICNVHSWSWKKPTCVCVAASCILISSPPEDLKWLVLPHVQMLCIGGCVVPFWTLCM